MSSAVQDMVTEGQHQIAQIESQIQDLDKQITEAQAQLAAIQQGRAERAQNLQQAQLLVTQAQERHTELSGYAKLAQGKSRQRQAVKDVADAKKTLDTAKAALAQLEREQEEASQADATREQELQKQLHLLQVEKETRQAEIREMQSGLNKAQTELGQERYAAFIAAYEEKRQEVDALLSQVVVAQAALENLRQDGLRELADWQNYHEQVEELGRSQEDPTIEAIEASIAYCDAMAELAPKVTTERLRLPVFHIPHVSGSGTAMDLIPVHQDLILAARHNQQALSQHRARLQRFHQEYSELLANGNQKVKYA